MKIEGAHYSTTAYRYDKQGRQNRVENANGTITRYVYNGVGQLLSTWVGTDDAPDSGGWSPANLAGTDMTKVSESVTIPANQASADVVLTPTADQLVEGSETATLILKASADYRLSTTHYHATATIADGPLIDLKIDSNNDGSITVLDDPIEADVDKPGKIIQVNDDDTDGDGIPDFADFYVPDDNPNGLTQRFVPLNLSLPSNLPPEARVTFTYSASNPTNIGLTGDGTLDNPHYYTPASGNLRIWTLGQRDGQRAFHPVRHAADCGATWQWVVIRGGGQP